MRKIGLVIACLEEIAVILNEKFAVISDYSGEEYPFKTYVYNIGNTYVYVTLSGVGEIASSAATQYLISQFECSAIFNYGVCGALKDDLNLQDVVILNGLVDLEFDTSRLDNCLPSTHIELGFNEPLMKIDNSLTNKIIENNKDLKAVVCASSNKFISDSLIKESIANKYGASVCEMESVGIYLTCLKNHVPCAFIKGVSDSKNGDEEEFKKMITKASERAFKVFLSII